MPIDRTNITPVDDDGTETTGTVFDAEWWEDVYDAIDAAIDDFETVVDLVDGATPALDASLGSVFRLTAAGDRTIAVPSNPRAGQRITIRHKASGGARTLALNSGAGGFRFGSTITALTATTDTKVDYIDCIYDATDNKWDVVNYVKGY